MSQEQEQTTDNVVMSINEYQTIPMPELSKEELKQERIAGIKQDIETKLQQYISAAATVRQKSSSAKTAYKRQYYEKKFQKIHVAVRHYVSMLQQIQQIAAKEHQDVDESPSN